MTAPPCELCRDAAGPAVWRADSLRVVRVGDTPDFPAYYRVVWNRHVAEFSALNARERGLCMRVVHSVEVAMRRCLHPAKVNLASLGNVVPHLHWHVIARFANDSHFPQPIWGVRQREPDPELMAGLHAALPALDQALSEALSRAPALNSAPPRRPAQ